MKLDGQHKSKTSRTISSWSWRQAKCCELETIN